MNIAPTLNAAIAPGTPSINRNEVPTTFRQAAMAKEPAGNAALKALPETAVATQEKQDEAVKKLNEFVAITKNALEFSIDEDSGRQLVKLIDTETKEIIRQFPTEEALQIAKALDKFQGLLIHNKA